MALLSTLFLKRSKLLDTQVRTFISNALFLQHQLFQYIIMMTFAIVLHEFRIYRISILLNPLCQIPTP